MKREAISKKSVIEAKNSITKVKEEVSKIVVGQGKVLDGILRALLSNGHVLLEGVPGVAKTLIVKTIAKTLGGDFKRIQFTPDLLPTDLTGVTAYEPKKGFYVIKGPIFTNFVLADEINRCPAKTQASLLEAMQEEQVTIGKKTFLLDKPFFVLATENPLEQTGVYALPEAQIDRFLFKLKITYPTELEETKILKHNIDLIKFEDIKIKKILNKSHLLKLQEVTKKIYLNSKIEKYIVNIVRATRHPKDYGISLGKYIQWGGSPRASIGLFIASKANALLSGRDFVTPQDVKTVAYDVLRHRILLNYEGQAERVNSERIIHEILDKIHIP